MLQVHDMIKSSKPSTITKLLIVGNPLPFHVAAHFQRAAQTLGYEVRILNIEQAYTMPSVLRRIYWRLGYRRPPHLNAFNQEVLKTCQQFKPHFILTTGIVPLTSATLDKIDKLGILTSNYLTDDPWNPGHKAKWFLEALPHYHHVFSPRRANLDDLRKLGCIVSYLPFAYDPTVHLRICPTATETEQLAADMLFAGGADSDRVPILQQLIQDGVNIALYGGYWERFSATKKYARGHADLMTLCKAVAAAKISVCLVRRANRDGHVMRTFEVPAMGGCMLVENTEEHREILGEEGEAVLYFTTADELAVKTRWLLTHEQERKHLAEAVYTRITTGQHTYADRLRTILERLSHE